MDLGKKMKILWKNAKNTAKTAPRGAVFAMLGARRTDARPGAAASLRVSQWQNCMHQIYFLK